MMNKIANTTAIYWLAAAFAAGFFVVGFPYWQIPYANVSLPDTLYGAGLLAVGVLAAAARAFGKARLMAVVLVVGAAVPAAVLARVVVDTAKDPNSHNLWPRVDHRSGSRDRLFVCWRTRRSLPLFFSKR